MSEERTISRREFARQGVGAAVAAVAITGGLGVAREVLPRPCAGLAEVVAEDVRRGQAPQATYAPRLESLRGRVIGFVSNGSWESERTFALIGGYLTSRWGCTVVDEDHFPIGQGILAKPDNGVAELMASYGVEAAILGNAACSHCALAVGRAAAQLELAGIPTVILARRYYERHLCYAFASFGLPSQPTVSMYFPQDMFEGKTDLEPLERGMEPFLRGLTSTQWAWRPAGLEIEI